MAFSYDEEKRLNSISAQVQKNLNSRLDGFRFREVDPETFDEDAGKHDDKQISFVKRDDDTIEMYMGDTQIGSSGSGGGKSAVMYANATWGWEYRGSNEYTTEQTTYGETKVNKIKKNADGQSAEDIFEIIPILSINPARQIDGKYEVRYINALWFKQNVFEYGDTYYLNYDESDTPYSVKPWNHCAYDSVSVTCYVEPYSASMTSYTVTLLYTIDLGMVIGKSPTGMNGDIYSQNNPWRGLNPWYDDNSVHEFLVHPDLYVREYWPYSSGFNLGRSKYISLDNFGYFISHKWHNFAGADSSLLRNMNYSKTNDSAAQSSNYSKEFGLNGVGIVFLPDDIEIEETVPHQSYTVKKFRPRPVIFSEDCYETITAIGDNTFRESYNNLAKRTAITLIRETNTAGSRLGLHYEINNGIERNKVRMTGAFPNYSQYPTSRMTQKWLETIYILQQGRKTDAP